MTMCRDGLYECRRYIFDRSITTRHNPLGGRDFIAGVTPADLTAPCTNPWAPDRSETVLGCLHTILDEEWEHHRYAIRDLDAIRATSGA